MTKNKMKKFHTWPIGNCNQRNAK